MREKLLRIVQKLPLVSGYFSGIATIFMLHRVEKLNPLGIIHNENMKVSPEFLEKFIQSLAKKHYKFISLDQLSELLESGSAVASDKYALFTLDDGYADNFLNALPIFERLNVPFTVYLTSSFCDREAILWWYILEDLLIQNDSINLWGCEDYPCKSIIEKNDLFLKIRNIILALDQNNLENSLKSLFKSYSIDWYKKCDELALNWGQAKEISQSNMGTIGGHTKLHKSLRGLSRDQMQREVISGNMRVQERIGVYPRHFSYPFGGPSEAGIREFSFIKSIEEIKTATTTRRGNIYLDHKNYLNCLPRIMLTEDIEVSDISLPRRRRLAVR